MREIAQDELLEAVVRLRVMEVLANQPAETEENQLTLTGKGQRLWQVICQLGAENDPFAYILIHEAFHAGWNVAEDYHEIAPEARA